MHPSVFREKAQSPHGHVIAVMQNYGKDLTESYMTLLLLLLATIWMHLDEGTALKASTDYRKVENDTTVLNAVT